MRMTQLFFAALVLVSFTGCERHDVAAPPVERKTVDVQAPGVHVEVKKKETPNGSKVKVDVEKDRR